MTRAFSLRIVLVTALLALFAAVPAAYAAKGGKPGTGSSLKLVLLDSTDGRAHHRHRVAFQVSTSATDRPFVGVRCWQGSNWVLDGYTGYFPTYLYDPWVTLNSPYWTAGIEATCTARLFHYDKRGNQVVLATLNFPAAA